MSPAEAETHARSILSHLIRERQRLRQSDGDAGELEANRLAIVYWQWQVTRALQARRAEAA